MFAGGPGLASRGEYIMFWRLKKDDVGALFEL